MPEPQVESWNEEEVYDDYIAPLMARIIALCQEHKIPMVASFAYLRDDAADKMSFCTTNLPFPGRKVESFERAITIILAST